MKIVTAAEMREIDRVTAEKFGVPSLTLMENAGRAIAECVPMMANSVLIICGKGNNGGDGFVAAWHLREMGKEVRVVLLARPEEVKGDAAEMLKRLEPPPVTVTDEDGLEQAIRESPRADVVIDAIFGTGFKPPAQGIYAAAINAINALRLPTIAVDLPSGVDADAMQPSSHSGAIVHAHEVVTFTALKPAHVFALDRIPTTLRQIGTPDEAVQSSLKLNVITRDDIAELVAKRKPQSNKGTYGHVLVVGGSDGKAGAPAMAGMAALRSGAGLCTVAAPRSIQPTVAAFMPELMTEPLSESLAGALSVLALDRFREIAKGKTVIAAGPGASMDPEAGQFMRAIFDRSEGPLVLDADGLNAFVGHVEQLEGNRRPLVMTPHPGELSRLNGMTIAEIQGDRMRAARNFAQQHHAYVVLKGHKTLVAEPDGDIWINTTGNPGMATGGTGDVLTGMIAGLIAQFPQQITKCVTAAVHLHGLAGDLAVQELGEMPLVATDIIRFLPRAIHHLQSH
jgi:ADP-dependent NAD(P)H-hydrate dehydratase / NAD(P)H-hydrate epimerase